MKWGEVGGAGGGNRGGQPWGRGPCEVGGAVGQRVPWVGDPGGGGGDVGQRVPWGGGSRGEDVTCWGCLEVGSPRERWCGAGGGSGVWAGVGGATSPWSGGRVALLSGGRGGDLGFEGSSGVAESRDGGKPRGSAPPGPGESRGPGQGVCSSGASGEGKGVARGGPRRGPGSVPKGWGGAGTWSRAGSSSACPAASSPLATPSGSRCPSSAPSPPKSSANVPCRPPAPLPLCP